MRLTKSTPAKRIDNKETSPLAWMHTAKLVTDPAERLFDFEQRFSVTDRPEEKVTGMVNPGSDFPAHGQRCGCWREKSDQRNKRPS
jgi:hypothetical protein